MSNTAREWDDILDECLDRVLWRNEPLDRCLADYPQHADELRGLLQAALATRQALAFAPRAEQKRAARLRFLAAIERRQRRPRLLSSWWFQGWRRWATSAAAALVVVGLGGASTVAASGGSVPGEPLYPVKRTLESVRLALTISGEDRARLYASYAERRVEEISIVTQRGETKHLPDLSKALERSLAQARGLAGVKATGAPVATTPLARPAAGGSAPSPRVEPIGPIQPDMPRPTSADQERLQQLLKEKFRRNHQVLKDLMEQVPPAARPALQRAFEKTQEAYEGIPESRPGRPEGKDHEIPRGKPETQQARGVLSSGDPSSRTIRVRLSNDQTLTLQVTSSTRVTLNGRPAAPGVLRSGDRLAAEFDPSSREALTVRAEREGP